MMVSKCLEVDTVMTIARETNNIAITDRVNIYFIKLAYFLHELIMFF